MMEVKSFHLLMEMKLIVFLLNWYIIDCFKKYVR